MRAMLALAALVFLTGCNSQSLEGTWDLRFTSDDPAIAKRLEEVSSFERTFRFEDDGKFRFTYGGQSADGEYAVSGDTITLTGEGSAGKRTDQLTWDRDADKITGRIGKLDATMMRSGE